MAQANYLTSCNRHAGNRRDCETIHKPRSSGSCPNTGCFGRTSSLAHVSAQSRAVGFWQSRRKVATAFRWIAQRDNDCGQHQKGFMSRG